MHCRSHDHPDARGDQPQPDRRASPAHRPGSLFPRHYRRAAEELAALAFEQQREPPEETGRLLVFDRKEHLALGRVDVRTDARAGLVVSLDDPARRRLEVLAECGELLGGQCQRDPLVVGDLADALGRDVDRLAERGRRDRQAVEDVLLFVAHNLVDGADLGAVGGVHLPTGTDHEPGNRVSHAGILRPEGTSTLRLMLSPSVDNLVAQLTRLPGIGGRTAQRLAFHLLQVPKDEALALATAIGEVKERVRFCRECGNLTEEELCSICVDTRRDRTTICVVEQPVDLVSLERTAEYRGLYHVLGGALSPLDGVEPEHLRIDELMQRVQANGVVEVVLATNPNATGEATASYLAGRLRDRVRVTRLASGLPVGGDLEYADEVTLGRALAGRREMT